ncbi:MAG: hypothetical protein WBE26_08510 [Phycisphaerae bacterium]
MSRSTNRRWAQTLAGTVAAICVISLTGCDVGREFREAATPAVTNGVSEIVNGLMDGLFAAIEVEPETSEKKVSG